MVQSFHTTIRFPCCSTVLHLYAQAVTYHEQSHYCR